MPDSPATPRSPVTVIGLGAMGQTSAATWLAAGHPVTVWNRSPEFRQQGDAVTPMHRHGTVEEVTAAVLFLAFDATFTTGARLTVDGGLGSGVHLVSPPAGCGER